MRTHSIVIALSLTTAACFQEHDPAGVETRGNDCYTCHRGEYEEAGHQTLNTVGCRAAVPPIHVDSKPLTCGDCHNTDAWCPALDGIHPETEFPIQRGPHQGIPCLECHSLPGESVEGMNVSCVTCHTRSWYTSEHHEGPGWDSSNPTFCRNSGCHPDGRKHDGKPLMLNRRR